jgi:hypothetical protein
MKQTNLPVTKETVLNKVITALETNQVKEGDIFATKSALHKELGLPPVGTNPNRCKQYAETLGSVFELVKCGTRGIQIAYIKDISILELVRDSISNIEWKTYLEPLFFQLLKDRYERHSNKEKDFIELHFSSAALYVTLGFLKDRGKLPNYGQHKRVFLEFDAIHVRDTVGLIRSRFGDLVLTLLQRLAKEGLIIFSKDFSFKIYGEEEAELIKDVERKVQVLNIISKVLMQMGYKNKGTMYFAGKGDEYVKRVCKEMKVLYGKDYYDMYELHGVTIGKDMLERALSIYDKSPCTVITNSKAVKMLHKAIDTPLNKVEVHTEEFERAKIEELGKDFKVDTTSVSTVEKIRSEMKQIVNKIVGETE